MKKSRLPEEDPVVAEVRAIRARMWQEAGGTIQGYLRLLDSENPDGPKAVKTKRARPGARKPKRRTATR